jgi:hypothetical protein
VNSLFRVAAAVGAVVVWTAWGSADVSALSCVERPSDIRAAEEAIQGEHPLWAMGYIVAVIESVTEDDDGGLLSVSVRPTHIFAGEYGDVITLRARPDGPPDARNLRPGRSFFLSLGRAAPGTGELLIQPCAPNFEVTPEQVDQLVAVAPEVEVRDSQSPNAEPESLPWPLIAAAAFIAVVGVGVGAIVWRR